MILTGIIFGAIIGALVAFRPQTAAGLASSFPALTTGIAVALVALIATPNMGKTLFAVTAVSAVVIVGGVSTARKKLLEA